MKIRNYLALIQLGALTLCFPAVADTFVLNDGTELEGELIRETETHYLARINVTPTIRERRELAKADVKEIRRTPADEIAFEKLEEFPTFSTARSSEPYQVHLDRINSFIEEFPDSDYNAELIEIKNRYQQEIDRLEKGEAKLNDEWISKEELDKFPYRYDAKFLLNSLRQNNAQGYLLNTLIEFEQNKEDFQNSESFGEMVEEANNALRQYQSYLRREIPQVEKRIAEREKMLAEASENERARFEEAFAAEDRRFEVLKSRAQRDRKNWYQISPHNLQDHNLALQQTERELTQLENYRADTNPPADPRIAEFWEHIDSRDLEAAQASLFSIQSLRIPEKYRAPLQQAFSELQKEVEKEKREAEEAARIAAEEAARKAAEEMSAEVEQTPAASNEEANAESDDSAEESTETTAETSNEVPEDSPSATLEDDLRSAEPKDKSSLLNLVPIFGLVALAILAAVIIVLKKKQANEE